MIDKHYFNLDELVRQIIRQIIGQTEVSVSIHKIHYEPSESVTVYADQVKIGSVIY